MAPPDGIVAPPAATPECRKSDLTSSRLAFAEAADRAVFGGAPGRRGELAPPTVPDYLRDTYSWAYLRPGAVRLLDRSPVVSAILWGNYWRLQRAVLAELHPGQRVLQPACVYGDLSPRLAAFLGPQGRLDVSDVSPLQVENCRRKLSAFSNATVRVWDAANQVGALYDVVCCFFLLHEMPDRYKHRVVAALLESVRPDGKLVFIDYHKPHWAHPLKGIMSLVFDTLEPFAKDLWQKEICHFASGSKEFVWRKHTYFGGLFQKVVAHRAAGSCNRRPDTANVVHELTPALVRYWP